LTFLSGDYSYFAAFRFAAQYAFIRSDCALLWAADRFLRFGAITAEGRSVAMGFFDGRPRRFTGPWSASMAWLSLSRS
jgi:hypothetical protein